MSDYFKSLDDKTKGRYREKLEAVGVVDVIEEDPFLWRNESGQYTDSVDGWPEVMFGHIYCYLISQPGKYTHANLNAFKSLEAYNFVQSGWVQTCFHRKLPKGW